MSASVKNPARRHFLRQLANPIKRFLESENTTPATPQSAKSGTAIIQGRHCLAYRAMSCTICFEQCPEPGAILLEQGIPRIDPATCSGCRKCEQACPAPTNAILFKARN